jgi:hypothetical protein
VREGGVTNSGRSEETRGSPTASGGEVAFILDNFLPGLADEKEERNEAGN